MMMKVIFKRELLKDIDLNFGARLDLMIERAKIKKLEMLVLFLYSLALSPYIIKRLFN